MAIVEYYDAQTGSSLREDDCLLIYHVTEECFGKSARATGGSGLPKRGKGNSPRDLSLFTSAKKEGKNIPHFERRRSSKKDEKQGKGKKKPTANTAIEPVW